MRKRVTVAIVMLVLLVDRPNKVEAGAFATEFTQVLNHGQLVMEYIRQGEQLAKAVQQLQDAIKNSEFSTDLTFGAILNDIESLDRIVVGGQALAYSLGNLDALFGETFPGYRTGNNYFKQYRKWSQTTLDTTRGVLRVAGLQSRQMKSEQAVIKALQAKARSPIGRMQALQVLQQISEHQVQQLMKLRELMIADMSSKQAHQAAIAQQEAAVKAASEQFFRNSGVASDGRTFRPGTH